MCMQIWCFFVVCSGYVRFRSELVRCIEVIHESSIHATPISPLWLDSQHFPLCAHPFTFVPCALSWIDRQFVLLSMHYSFYPRFLIIVIHLHGIVNGWHCCRAHFTQNCIIFYKYTCFCYHPYTISLCVSLFQVALHGNRSHVHRHTRFCSSIYCFTRLSTIAAFLRGSTIALFSSPPICTIIHHICTFYMGDAISSPYFHSSSQLSPLHFFLFPPMMHWCKMIDSVAFAYFFSKRELILFLPFIRR